MALILCGVLLWGFAHGLKRLLPGQRAAMGDGGRGLVALLSIVAIVLMVLGHRTAETQPIWIPPDWLSGLNNLLMLLSIYLFAVGGARSRLASKMRHPMLNGAILWGLAHIMVNVDAPSILLFGGIGVWAMITKRVINRSEAWVPPEPGTLGKEFGVALASVLVFLVVAQIHGLLGPWPLWSGWPTGGLFAPLLTPLFDI